MSRNSEKAREELVEAALRLFAERGYYGVTVKDVLEEADTHLSVLNYYFRSKDALYREAILRACDKASFSQKDREVLLQLEPHRALYIVNLQLKIQDDRFL